MKRNESAASRQSAISTGDKTYMGKPCSHGHSGLRYVANRVCATCHAERNAKAVKTYDSEGARARQARYRARLKAKAQSTIPTDLGSDLLDAL